jgi:integrase
LFDWAVKLEHIEKNPTDGVTFERPDTEGFAAWTESEISQFEAHWPIGTRERLALAIFIYTGLRRGDAATLGRQHVTDGVISLKTERPERRSSSPFWTSCKPSSTPAQRVQWST